MRTLFIADLHLSEKHPQITDTFFSFLENETKDIDALYILGDLFEVWIGDDECTQLSEKVATQLSITAQKNNFIIYYIHGNRDFMLGQQYAQKSSMKLLNEHSEIDLYGTKALVMHGDTLCLADKSYQTMRKVIHNPLIQTIFNLLPLSLRRKIGAKLRNASQENTKSKSREIMDVTQSEVIRLMVKHQVKTLIHGHTHHVAEHTIESAEGKLMRFDVGDWFNHFSYVEAQKGSIKIIKRTISYYQ